MNYFCDTPFGHNVLFYLHLSHEVFDCTRLYAPIYVYSGVASYEALGHVPPRVLEILCILQLAASLTANISKITKEKHVLHFRLSCQKHAKTQVNRLKQSPNYNKSRAGEEKFLLYPPSP